MGYYEIFISESDTFRTTVRTIPHFRASLWLGKNFKGWVTCTSRGYVEQLLIDDLRAQIKESRLGEARGHQPDKGVDKESDKRSTTHILKTQAKDDKGTVKPEIHQVPETELRNLRIKYENALQEREKLNNEITLLKRNKHIENNEKKTKAAELSKTESPPELTKKPDNDVATKLLLNKKHTLAAAPLIQGEDDNTQFFTIQTGSFLTIDRAREHFDFIADLLQAKDHDNLRIEKIGRFYTVRLGKYDNYSSADDLLRKLIHKIKSPVILKAYIKESRIIKLQSTQSQ